MFDLDETIAAIASAPGGAARGVVRLSGPQAAAILGECFRPADGARLANQTQATASRGLLDLGEPLGAILGDLFFWPTTRSYTRQPSGELHLFGSPPILEAAVRRLISHGARLARPGEFTMRAFLAGRLDLTQAEAVLGVIDARDATELQTALGQLAGGLATPLGELRGNLLDLLAHLEAGLDFVEEDIEFITANELQQQLAASAGQIERLMVQTASRSLTQSAYPIVLRGLPNAGKSSLLNALVGDEAAIVSELAGTTRDYVARLVTVEGLECLLTDTAGVDPLPRHAIEAAAQQASARQVEHSRLELLCLDGSRSLAVWEQEQLAAESQGSSVGRLIVQMKSDLPQQFKLRGAIPVSSRTGVGLDRLRSAIRERIEQLWHRDSSIVADTAIRCGDSLRGAADALRRAHEAAEVGLGEELVAAEVRGALEELGRVVGAVYTDDVLDRIFSRFCIGK
jgi:tRNA modification GTPase